MYPPRAHLTVRIKKYVTAPFCTHSVIAQVVHACRRITQLSRALQCHSQAAGDAAATRSTGEMIDHALCPGRHPAETSGVKASTVHPRPLSQAHVMAGCSLAVRPRHVLRHEKYSKVGGYAVICTAVDDLDALLRSCIMMHLHHALHPQRLPCCTICQASDMYMRQSMKASGPVLAIS